LFLSTNKEIEQHRIKKQKVLLTITIAQCKRNGVWKVKFVDENVPNECSGAKFVCFLCYLTKGASLGCTDVREAEKFLYGKLVVDIPL